MLGFGKNKLKLQCYRCEKNFKLDVDLKNVKPEGFDYHEGAYMSHTLESGFYGNWLKVGDDKCPFCEVTLTIAVSDEGKAIGGDGSFAKFCMDNADKRLKVKAEWMTLQEWLEENPDDEKLQARINEVEELQDKLEQQEIDRYNKYYEEIAIWRNEHT